MGSARVPKRTDTWRVTPPQSGSKMAWIATASPPGISQRSRMTLPPRHGAWVGATVRRRTTRERCMRSGAPTTTTAAAAAAASLPCHL